MAIPLLASRQKSKIALPGPTKPRHQHDESDGFHPSESHSQHPTALETRSRSCATMGCTVRAIYQTWATWPLAAVAFLACFPTKISAYCRYPAIPGLTTQYALASIHSEICRPSPPGVPAGDTVTAPIQFKLPFPVSTRDEAGQAVKCQLAPAVSTIKLSMWSSIQSLARRHLVNMDIPFTLRLVDNVRLDGHL